MCISQRLGRHNDESLASRKRDLEQNQRLRGRRTRDRTSAKEALKVTSAHIGPLTDMEVLSGMCSSTTFRASEPSGGASQRKSTVADKAPKI
jgi:hypothetical protein